MKTYKVAATMIIRPYLTVKADSKEEAEEKVRSGEFDEKEAKETGFPVSNIEVDEVSEVKSQPLEY